MFNTLRPRQNGRHFADDIFKFIFLNENVWMPIKISLNFAPQGPINNIPALVEIMAWCQSGDKPLSEPMMVSLLTHICVTLRQSVKTIIHLLQVCTLVVDWSSKCHMTSKIISKLYVQAWNPELVSNALLWCPSSQTIIHSLSKVYWFRYWYGANDGTIPLLDTMLTQTYGFTRQHAVYMINSCTPGQNGHHHAGDNWILFSWKKSHILIKLHWSLFQRVQIKVTQHWCT